MGAHSSSKYDASLRPDDDEEAQPFLSDDLDGAIKLQDRRELEVEDGCCPASARGRTMTAIPKAQLAVLCAVRLVDPIMFTVIFPYVNEMMAHFHLTDDPSKVGLYSGMVESSFAIAQLLSIYHWARLSDKIGRKPVVLTGIAGIAVGTLFMGFSRSLAGVLFARSLAGFFSGNVAVVHSIIGEITDSSNQAIAFPIYGLCWPLGAIIGPLLGGTFSNPAEKYPQFFDFALFRAYPYLLPSLIAASIAASGAIFGLFFLEESLPSKRRRRQDSTASFESFQGGNAEKPPPAVGIKYLLSIPVVRALCLSGGALSFINTAFDVIFVLYCYSPILTGGLNFTAAEIGLALASSGAISAGLQLFFMPYLLRCFDHARMYNACMAIWPFTFALLPGLNVIARLGAVDAADGALAVAGPAKALLWVGIYALLLMARCACLAFSVSMILVKDSAPDPSSLGATNGLAQFAMCLTRAFSPAFASTLFAFSAGFVHFWPMRFFWVLAMVAVSCVGTAFSRRIAEGMRAAPPRPS